MSSASAQSAGVQQTTRQFGIGQAALFTISMRIFYSVLAPLFSRWIKVPASLVASNEFSASVLRPTDGIGYSLWGVWQRFDTLWYVHIAQNGYDSAAAVVFYPLYPMLIRILTPITRNPYVAALAISTVATFFAIWGLARLLSLDLSPETAYKACLCWLAWPASFILFAGYPESLVAALIIWAILSARTERWWVAGVLGLLAAGTKAVGALVVIPLAILAWRGRKKKAVPAVILPMVAPAAFVALALRSAQLLPSQAYAEFWRTTVSYPWTTLWLAITQGNNLVTLNLMFLLIAVVFSTFRPVRIEYTVFVLAAALMFLTKKTEPLLQSTVRYTLVLFPAFAGMAQTKSRILFAIALAALFALNLKLFWAFLGWNLVV